MPNADESEPLDPLPPRPEPGDCCGGGCAVCVLEGYAEEVERWEQEVAEILRRRAEPGRPQLPLT